MLCRIGMTTEPLSRLANWERRTPELEELEASRKLSTARPRHSGRKPHWLDNMGVSLIRVVEEVSMPLGMSTTLPMIL